MRVLAHNQLPGDGDQPPALALRIDVAASSPVAAMVGQPHPAMLTGPAPDLKRPDVQRGTPRGRFRLSGQWE